MKLVATIASLTLYAGLARADRVSPHVPVPAEEPPPVTTPPSPVRGPSASPETSALGVKVVGAYSCKGTQLVIDGSSRPIRGKLTIKYEPDFGWIQSTYVQELPGNLKIADFRSYDNVAKQWTRLRLTSSSAHETATSLGEQNGNWTWTGTESSSVGTTQHRDHEEVSKTSLKLWGESMLSGKWQKQYEVTCTR